MNNLYEMEREAEMMVIKSQLIRSALKKKPWLSRDVMTALPRKAALVKLIKDIQVNDHSGNFALFLLDIDDLKALNSARGHEGADRVIARVGKVLKAHVDAVKEGKVYGLVNAWCFRQGGDEYALVVQTKEIANMSDALLFYESFHGAINALEVGDVAEEMKQEGIKALKERARKQMENAMNSVKLDKQAKVEVMGKFEQHLKGQEMEFHVKRVCISTGLFVPGDWEASLKWADEAQDAAKA